MRSRAPTTSPPRRARRRLRPDRVRGEGRVGGGRGARVRGGFSIGSVPPGWKKKDRVGEERHRQLCAQRKTSFSGVFDGGTRRVCRARRASRFEKRSFRFARGARPGAFGRGVRSRTRRAGRSRRAPTRGRPRRAPGPLAPRSRVGAGRGAGAIAALPRPPSPRRRSRLAPFGRLSSALGLIGAFARGVGQRGGLRRVENPGFTRRRTRARRARSSGAAPCDVAARSPSRSGSRRARRGRRRRGSGGAPRAIRGVNLTPRFSHDATV